MNNEEFEIIEIDEKEYVIFKKINLNEKNYFLLNEIQNDTLGENTIVLEEKDGFLNSIEDEKEKVELTKYILSEMKSVEE